mmetsp:Transcript_65506/g.211230  ORF Transcript_65506/g.211230 Transcript_65506/m.211230 type:complete len:210 (-) Transcript_65506:625-1254(-)
MSRQPPARSWPRSARCPWHHLRCPAPPATTAWICGGHRARRRRPQPHRGRGPPGGRPRSGRSRSSGRPPAAPHHPRTCRRCLPRQRPQPPTRSGPRPAATRARTTSHTRSCRPSRRPQRSGSWPMCAGASTPAAIGMSSSGPLTTRGGWPASPRALSWPLASSRSSWRRSRPSWSPCAPRSRRTRSAAPRSSSPPSGGEWTPRSKCSRR